MILTIDEHSISLHKIPYKAFVLDLGCRGFGFTDYFRERGHIVYPIDIDEFPGDYLRMAISDKTGNCGIEHTLDKQATHIKPGNEVEMHTIQSFSEYMEVEHWDVIKMDIEGEEVNILRSAKHPMATQVSVEFHAHCGHQTKQMLDELLDSLEKWYTIENRVWEARHGAGYNYWDILMIAK